jgi:hypothetical protein
MKPLAIIAMIAVRKASPPRSRNEAMIRPSSERCQHALGRVAVLEAAEDHPFLRRFATLTR